MTTNFNTLKQAFAETVKIKLKEIILNFKQFRDINKIDENGNTILHRAIIENNIEQVKLIIQSQSIIKHNLALFYKNNQDLTPVDLILQEANTEPNKFSPALKKIVINAQDLHGNTALHKAILESDIAKTQSLIQHGADIFLQNDNGMCALQILFDQQDQGLDQNFDQLLNLLVNTQDLYGNNALHYMASNSDLFINEKWKNIISNQSNKFVISNQKTKYIAAKQKLCVDHANNINKQNDQGYAPLHYAVITKNYALVHTLLDHNADINIQDNQDYTALHHAIKIKNITLVHTLLARGANPNLADLKGYSPLDYIKTREEPFYYKCIKLFHHYKNDFISNSPNALADSDIDHSVVKSNQSEIFSALDCPEQLTQGSDSNLTGEAAG
jgi:ankyrin repeat protein